MDKQIITFICTKSFLWTYELIFLPGNHHHSALILILEHGIQRSNGYRDEEESGVVVKVTMGVPNPLVIIIFYFSTKARTRSGSVVECFTRDQEVAG